MNEEIAHVKSDSYLDIQAHVGVTKHNGGLAATRELMRRCHAAEAREVLYVGSGIGVGPVTLVRETGCSVVAVDISEKMLEWSRLRAREAGLSSRIDVRLGDVCDLPFEHDRFDVVLVESVLAFVEDKPRAIQECVRVAAPGGRIGMNETVWLRRPATGKITEQATALGAFILSAEEWEQVWCKSGLVDLSTHVRPVGVRKEMLSRIGWVGLRWSMRAFWRLLRLIAQQPAAREAIRSQFRAPAGVVDLYGYVLATGRKPDPARRLRPDSIAGA